MIQRPRLLTPAVSLLFFSSGFASLIYEVIWFKRFSHVWGNSTLAQAVVVTGFLSGLALGALWIGRLADRLRSPLFWYGGCEALIGVMALIIPYEIQSLRGVYAAWYPLFLLHPALKFITCFMFTFMVIGPPCALMGGTLPLLIRHFSSVHPWGRETTGWLYAFNTLGAALGCYASGMHLLPRLGILRTNDLAAGLNLLVALGSIFLAYRLPALSRPAAASETAPLFPRLDPRLVESLSPRWIRAALAASGAAALMLQMVWMRKLAVLLGGTTYAFSSMLCVFLLGIGLGSLVYSRIAARIQNLSRLLLINLSLLGVTTALALTAIPALTDWMGAVLEARSNPWYNDWVCFASSAVLQLAPTLSMGFLFPLLVDLLRGPSERVGSQVGNAYAWNTAGSIAGAPAAMIWLFPSFGTAATLAAAILLYAFILLAVYPGRQREEKRALRLALLLLTVAAWFASSLTNPLKTELGNYLYGKDLADNLFKEYKLVYFKEGSLANVMVTTWEGEYHLRVNGKVDATKKGDMAMQMGLAYFPRFFMPEAKKVLIIGYGSGSTTGASLLFPGTRVTCCEIEPAVIEAGRYFYDVNHRPERSPNFRLILDDGRSFVEGTPETFDLILSEPSNPWMAGISNLFTQEFYQQVMLRLHPGGMLVQWIHTYQFTSHEYRMIARTLLSVFPHAALLRVSESDTLFLASSRPMVPDALTLQKAQALVLTQPEVVHDLVRYFETSDVLTLLLSHFLLSEDEIRAYVAEDPSSSLNTDLNLRLEFDAPLQMFYHPAKVENVDQTLIGRLNPQGWVERYKAWGGVVTQLPAAIPWLRLLGRYEYPLKRQALVEVLLPQMPDDPEKIPDPYLLAEKTATLVRDASAFEHGLEILTARSLEQAYRTGVMLWNHEQYSQGKIVFSRVVQQKTDWPSGWTFLALCHAKLGEWEEAETAFQKARTLDPDQAFFKQAYSKYLEMKQGSDED